MRIDELTLVNFRCFERRTFKFSERMNVLIGKNGTGKTAFADALAATLLPFPAELGGEERADFPAEDVRLKSIQKGREITFEPQSPCTIDARFRLGSDSVASTLTISRSPSALAAGGAGAMRHDTARLQQYALELASAVSKGEDVTLPVVAYFRTDRRWKASGEQASSDLLSPGSRLRGYATCLSSTSSYTQLASWFQRMEFIKSQEGEAPPMLDAAKKAIATCLEGWDEVLFHARLNDLVARTRDGSFMPFRMLSDGVRNMIGMVGEIAYRAALLNPHLGADAARKTPGIVLIDEIDLHLHPSWQRRVVDDLRRAFPEIQFFATTHSPIIVQSLRAGELIDLDGGPNDEYETRSVEDILEGVMGVPDVQRSKRWHAMRDAAAEYYRALREAKGASPEEMERLKTRLDELSAPFGNNPAYVAWLEMKRQVAGLGDPEP